MATNEELLQEVIDVLLHYKGILSYAKRDKLAAKLLRIKERPALR